MASSLALPQQLVGTEIERALIDGDLKALTPTERINYYRAICASLGLNALTKPFGYIVLNGKLTLYALKDCTEQLRKIRKVSITSVVPSQIGELYVVVASGKDLDERTDSATGAVTIGGLKGEALANAMMKAETKAKRRLTLSLCGLGILDETEVQTLKDQGVAHEEPLQNPPQPTAVSPASGTITKMTETTTVTCTAPAKTNDGPFYIVGDRVTCTVLNAHAGETLKGKIPYVKIKFNGDIPLNQEELSNGASTFHRSQFPHLLGAVGKEISFVYAVDKGQKYINIEELLSVGGVEIAKEETTNA